MSGNRESTDTGRKAGISQAVLTALELSTKQLHGRNLIHCTVRRGIEAVSVQEKEKAAVDAFCTLSARTQQRKAPQSQRASLTTHVHLGLYPLLTLSLAWGTDRPPPLPVPATERVSVQSSIELWPVVRVRSRNTFSAIHI